jgi:16S rRNA (cytosine1402-N4)-methyltransferase
VVTQHIAVMVKEVVEGLAPRPGGAYIDGTVGGGGHTGALLERSAPDGRVLGIDADPQAVAGVARGLSGAVAAGRLRLIQGNFADLEALANAAGFVPADGVLLDLGWSSDQLADTERGFSFATDAPLDMRYDVTRGVPAFELLQTLSEQELADLLWRYGEERRSRQIARLIVAARQREPITRTGQLASLVARVLGGRASRGRHPGGRSGSIHPATRTFQALRIAVNDELRNLEVALPQALTALAPGGRLAVIAFHSLEDRVVKTFLRREARDCICPPETPVCVCGHQARVHILTPRPVTPSAAEVTANPRARSARLRIAERIWNC